MTLTAERVSEPVSTVPEAVARLEELGRLLSEERDRDGLRHFNRLYLRVTSEIDARLREPAYFLDKPFLHTLDVEFANRYLEAVGNHLSNHGPVPYPWRELFRRRHKRGILRLQYAAAGVNAHINFDLAQALVATWARHPRRKGDDQWHDYDKVNAIFGELYMPLRDSLNCWIEEVDHGPVRDALDTASRFLVTGSRRAAWRDAEELAEKLAAGESPWIKVASMSAKATGVSHALLQRLG